MPGWACRGTRSTISPGSPGGWPSRWTSNGARITEICDGPEWVLDSAYGSWRDVPLARADLVVGLDFPRWVSLGRLIRRTAGRLVTGAEVCNGNRESLRDVFAADSIIRWHFRSFRRKRQNMRRWYADPAGPPVVLLRSPAEAVRWLETLPRHHAG